MKLVVDVIMLFFLVGATFGLQLGMSGANGWKNKLIFYTFIFLEVLFAIRIVERDIVTPYELIEIKSNFVKSHFGFLLDFSWLSSIIFDVCDFILGLLILYLFSNSVDT